MSVYKMLGDVSDDATVKLNILWPDVGVMHLSIKSAGLSNFLQLPVGLMSA